MSNTTATHARSGRQTSARSSFHAWRKSRPFWGGLWALLGGSLIAFVPATAWKFSFVASNLIWAGVLVGALIGAMGILMWMQPQLRILLGVVTILLSLTSFFTSDFGGLFLGMLMGLVGGSLGIGWMPNPPLSRRERRRLVKLGAEPAEVGADGQTIDLVEADRQTDLTIDLIGAQRNPEAAATHNGGRHRR